MFLFKFKDHEKQIYQHISDLRKHLLIFISYFLLTFGVVFYFSNPVFNFLAAPLFNTLSKYDYQALFITTSLPEGFIAYIKMAFGVSLFLLLPALLIQLTIYLLPIFIKTSEKVAFLIIAGLSPFLFYAGAGFAYFFSFHVIWSFFVKFAIAKNFKLYLKVGDYINLSLKVMVGLGICFELPVILLLLNKIGIISYKRLQSFRKPAILIAFIVGAVITPPDPFSQIIMALILIFLYELSLFIIKLNNKNS